MLVVVGSLTEERSGAVGRRRHGVGVGSVGLSECHVVQGNIGVHLLVEEVCGLLALLILGVVDFLTEEEREVVVVLDGHVVAGSVGPCVGLGGAIGDRSDGSLLVHGRLSGRGEITPEAVGVAEADVVVTLRTEYESGDGIPLQRELLAHGVAVLLLDVGLDVGHGVGQVEELCVGLALHAAISTPVAQTSRGLILQHAVDETARTDVGTACTLVTTEGELGVVGQCQVLGDVGVKFEIDVGAAYAGTEDDTLVLRLCEREVELGRLVTATDGDVGLVAPRMVAQHLVLPVA